MENYTIHLILFLAGLLLGVFAMSGSWRSRMPSYPGEYYPPVYNPPPVYPMYPPRQSGWGAILLAILAAIALMLILAAQPGASKETSRTPVERVEGGKKLSPALYDVNY